MSRFKEGDKVIVKGLDLAFVVACYLEDNLVKLFIEGESATTMHSIIHATRGATTQQHGQRHCRRLDSGESHVKD